jgi:hypothetical protein
MKKIINGRSIFLLAIFTGLIILSLSIVRYAIYYDIVTPYIFAYVFTAIAMAIPLNYFFAHMASPQIKLFWVRILAATLIPGIVIMIMFLFMKNSIEPIILDHKFDQMIAPACQGQPVKGAAQYQPNSGTHPIVLFQNNSSIQDVPKVWLPKSLEAVELVACVGEEEKVQLNLCEYDDGSKVRRIQYKVVIRLVAASTGQLLETITVDGTEPEVCPFEKHVDLGTSEMAGNHIFTRDLTRVLNKWAFPK